MHLPRLRVNHTDVVLGSVAEPAELPELLRHVADFYDDNPDVCESLFRAPAVRAVPPTVAHPFSGFAGNDNARYYC